MPARPDPQREQRLRDLVAKGLDDAVIGARLGMKPNGVARARSRLGLSANRQSAYSERP